MTVFMPGPKARTFNYRAGDVGYVPVSGFHYVQNIGKEKLIFLEVFNKISSRRCDYAREILFHLTKNLLAARSTQNY